MSRYCGPRAIAGAPSSAASRGAAWAPGPLERHGGARGVDLAGMAIGGADQAVEDARLGERVPRAFDEVELGARPRLVQRPRRARRARHVVAAVDDGPGDVGEAAGVAQE